MRSMRSLFAAAAGLALAGAALAAEPIPAPAGATPPGRIMPAPCTPCPGYYPGMPSIMGQPGDLGAAIPPVGAGAGDSFAQTPERGTEVAGSFNPAMFGDIVGFSGRQRVFLPRGQFITLPSGVTVTSVPAALPVAANGAFKISDNESPRPTNRVFGTYNYYANVNRAINAGEAGAFDVHREIVGFEKTFLNGNASFGMRVPFIQLTANSLVSDSQFGDLVFILKYAFLNNAQTGNVISAGLVVTAPTGEDFVTFTGDRLHPVLLQPWGGYLFNFGNLYVHGFTAVEVATDSVLPILLNNDIGVGYWLFRRDGRDRLFNGIVPTLEAHVNTPLSNRGSERFPVGFPDVLSLTGGANFVFLGQSTLGAAVGVPLTGPKPYDIEALVQLNIRF